jgi:ribonuclease HI
MRLYILVAMRINIYTDGGVVARNPSEIGGTWCYRLVDEHGILIQMRSGLQRVTSEWPVATNNVMELWATLKGLRGVPSEPPKVTNLHLFTDSEITAMRLRSPWRVKMNGVPEWMVVAIRQLCNLWQYELEVSVLAGHPSKRDLEKGATCKGTPVSWHNVECDKECGRLARAAMGGYSSGPGSGA